MSSIPNDFERAKMTDSNRSDFSSKDRVFIHGLQKAKQFNNLIGIVECIVDDTSPKRYKVSIININKSISIKPQNISHSTDIHEIESILHHLAKDEKCAMVSQFVSTFLPKRSESINPAQYYEFKKIKDSFAGCMSVYFAAKYIIFASCSKEQLMKFEMKYDDYDGKENVLRELKSFPDQTINSNEICACFLELEFVGFERKFRTNYHVMVIIKCNDKFRIIQSFEQNFNLTTELNSRSWIDKKEMKQLIEALIDVLFGNDADRATDGFKKLYRYPLKTINKKKFKKRKCVNCLGIYVANNVQTRGVIKNGNILIQDILKHIK